MKQVIAMFGGSFNPPTLAHRRIVEEVQAVYPGVPLVLLPAPRVAHKDPATLAPFADRMAMARMMVSDKPDITVSDFGNDVQSEQTIDMLDAWRTANPDTHIIWVMGADSFVSLPQWERWTDIMETTSLFIVARSHQVGAVHDTEPAQHYAALECKTPGEIAMRTGWYVDTQFHAPFSATEARNALTRGEISPYVAPDIADYIMSRRLYRQ